MEMSGQLHASAALPPRGKSPQYPLDKKLRRPQSRYGRCKEEKILEPSGTRTLMPQSFRPQKKQKVENIILTFITDTQRNRDTVQWQTFVTTVMNVTDPWKQNSFDKLSDYKLKKPHHGIRFSEVMFLRFSSNSTNCCNIV
jgi:hypothetical protein